MIVSFGKVSDVMSKINTPTLDRMLEIQGQSQLCGEFLEWLQSKYTMYDKKVKREFPFMDVMRDTGDYINIEKLLAEFFDIDLDEAEKEKTMLMEAEKNKTKPHHCELCGAYIKEERLQVCDECGRSERGSS